MCVCVVNGDLFVFLRKKRSELVTVLRTTSVGGDGEVPFDVTFCPQVSTYVHTTPVSEDDASPSCNAL